VSLAFLSPHPSAQTPARSPLLDPALAAGARSEVRDGWEVVASFGDPAAGLAACRESVGFADLSDLIKFELQRPPAAAAAEFAPGHALRLAGGWRCPLRPTRELLLAEPNRAAIVGAELERDGARACDLTASLAAIAIAGPLARETFARFCALDLRPERLAVGGFLPGSVARTPGYVLREGPDRFLMLFGAAYAQYVWETVADAAAGRGGRPVAASALPAIELEAGDA
jgi:heterotetrameric sarcosine oxidase gamma subunit